MASPVPTVPNSLITPSNLQKRYPVLCQNVDVDVLAEICTEATAHLEDITSRRLAPFTGQIYQDQIFGIDPDEYGDRSAGMPIGIYGSLGTSYANALGAGDLVRHFWLDQYAPTYPELWTYTIDSATLYLTYGNSQPLDFSGGGIIGPDVTDGHCWIRLGTFAPEGSRVSITYSGGYTQGIPPSLARACYFQAVQYLVLEAEPQLRKGLNLDEIDKTIHELIGPWVRS